MNSSFTSSVAAALTGITLLVSGCAGYITTPIPASTNPPGFIACPVLGPTIPQSGCPGLRLNNVLLTCAGNGGLSYTLSTTQGGGTRITATLTDGSVFTASATPVDGRCFDGLTVQVGITLGVIYTADVGVENTGPTAGTACIVRSRANFTQFITADPLLLNPGVEQLVKDKLHEQFDTRIISLLFRASGAPASPARCARWRPL